MSYDVTLVVCHEDGTTNHLYWMAVDMQQITSICDDYVRSDFKIVSLNITQNTEETTCPC